MSTIWRAGAMVLAMLLGAQAVTAAEVTLCRDDAQAPLAGKGINLLKAIELGGVITFACGGPVTIRISRSHTITRNTRIDGGGTVTLDGQGHRIFVGVNAALVFTITNLAIVNAGTPPVVGRLREGGGAVHGRYRRVELVEVSITRSWWPIHLTAGALRVTGSYFANNRLSVLTAPAIDVRARTRFLANDGAPIYSTRSDVVIDRSEFVSNAVPITVSSGTIAISRSTFLNNKGTSNGGALRLGCDTTIEESEFRDNAGVNGGAIHISGNAGAASFRAVKFHRNSAKGVGGAISVQPALDFAVTMRHMTFEGNTAIFGGALSLQPEKGREVALNGGALAFVDNSAAEAGGGIFAPNATIQLTRGVFIKNQAGVQGGAIAALQNGAGSTILANSLVVRNSASQGAAFWGSGATFVNSTFADNGGGSVWPSPLAPGPVWPLVRPIRFVNTIVAASSGNACGPIVNAAQLVDGGHNLQFPGNSCGVSIVSVNPALGDHYVPFFWSPALNKGDATVCAADPIARKDLYNTRRPANQAVCTIGAVEGSIDHLTRRWLEVSDERRWR